MAIRSIKIRAEFWPAQNLQATPRVKSEIDNVSKFIAAVELAAKEYLPTFGARLRIKEVREKDSVRGETTR